MQPPPKVSQRALSAQVEHALVTWVYPQRRELARLVAEGAFNAEEREKAFARLAVAASATLGVARTSIWILRPDASAIDCLHLFEQRRASHTKGATIHAKDAPRYFEALAKEHVIAAHDARLDPQTREFAEGYLEPLGITSMLDAPIFVRGRARGVICHEHVGPARVWQFWEELVASTFADFVSAILEAESRAQAVLAARANEAELKKVVEERTLALTESERNLQALLDTAPVPLLLTRASNHGIVYANRRAIALLAEEGATSVVGSSNEFWVEEANRETFLTQLLTEGRVDNFEAEFCKRGGKKFWVQINAQAMRYRGEVTFVIGLLDVTAHRRAEEALRRSAQTLSTLLDATPSPLIVTTLEEGEIRYCNAPAKALLGLDEANMALYRTADFYGTPQERADFVDLVRTEGQVEGMTHEVRTASGKAFWALVNAKRFTLDGEELFMIGFSDLTAQKEQELRLQELATIDELTGAFNRRQFFELGEREIERAKRYGSAPSLAMLDVDHFKAINDDLGHAAGDSVLRELVQVVREQVRTVDIVARIGGEEFVILLPSTALEAAALTVERVRSAIEQRRFQGVPAGRRVTVSIGLVTPQGEETLSALLRRSDECLYDAKEDGRNRVSLRPRST